MRAFLDYLIYVCAFCVIGVGALGAWDAVSHQPPVLLTGGAGEAVEDATSVLPEPFPGRNKITVLIVGADERPELGDKGRSDTMILLFVNPRTNQAAMLSIPRDLYVRIPGHGRDRINHAFYFGGVDLIRETVEDEFEVDIDYWAKVNLANFVEIVDSLGGVEIDVPDVEGRGRGMNYDDEGGKLHIHLKPGRQHLDGEQAMGFVRYRKSNTPGLGDGDFKRSERQHQFLKAMAEQKLKLRNVPQLMRLPLKILEAVDTNMSWREAVDMARAIRKVRPDCLMSASLQPYLRSLRVRDMALVDISDSDINRVLSEINQHLRSIPGQINLVEVLNGSGETGAAATVGEVLSEAGFEIIDTANADSFDHQRTLIYHPDDGLSAARRAQRTLGAGELVEIDESAGYSPDRITIIVGSDVAITTMQTAG
ncbi:MAG: LCP family protein [Armatimonadota bacterium]|nr:LCP family protein [Armatimonadota bacterium]